MIKEKVPAIQKLSKQEKIALAGELWNEAMQEDEIELTQAQKRRWTGE